MSLSEKDVIHVAKLAALDISNENISSLQEQLSEVLRYVDKLNQVDTTNIEPTSHVHGAVNAFRDDIISDSLNFEKLKINSPTLTKQGYKVPKII